MRRRSEANPCCLRSLGADSSSQATGGRGMRSKGTETRRLMTGWSLFHLASICADDGVPGCGVLCRWHGKDVLPAPVVSIKCILFFSNKPLMPCSSNAAASTSMDASVDEMPVLVDHAARATTGKRFGSLLLSTAGKGAARSGGFDYDLVIIGHGAALHAVDKGLQTMCLIIFL